MTAVNPNGDIAGAINARGFIGGINGGTGDGGDGGDVHVAGGASTLTDGGAHTYTSTLDFDLDMSGFSGARLLVGLLDPLGEGNGFDNLRFRIFQEGNTVLDQNFATLASALTYFDDGVIDLGAWSSGLVGDLDLTFQLDVVASAVNDGFHLNLVAGVTGVVPVPPAVWLFGSGLLGLVGIARRKKAA